MSFLERISDDGWEMTALSISERPVVELSNDCHDPETGEFCGDGDAAWKKTIKVTKNVTTSKGLSLRLELKQKYDGPDHEDGEYLGGSVTAYHQDQEVGYLPYGSGSDNQITVGDMVVTKFYQRQGVATSMFDFVREQGVPLQHNAEGMTPAGRKFMEAEQERSEFSNACHDPETGQFCETGGGYKPDHDAPDEGEWLMPEYDNPKDPLGLKGPAPVWRQSHKALVENALWSWKGDPVSMNIHMTESKKGAPVPDSGSGKQMRKQAEALLWEVHHKGRPNPSMLYRGAGTAPQRLEGWSTKKNIARRFAKPGHGDNIIYRIPKGKAGKAIRIADYISSGLDFDEQEWIVEAATIDGGPLTASGTTEFANPCHNDHDGRFCETHGPAFPTADVQRPLNPKAPKNYHQESEEWIAKLTPEEQLAATDYTGSYLYDAINKAAVEGTPDPRVAALDRALAKAGKRDTPIRAYRRVGVKDSEAFLAENKVGDVISLAQPGAFQSTSITPRYPVVTGWHTGSILFEINARSGAAVGDVTRGGGTAKEKELLIPRTAKFRIVAIQPDVQFGPPPKTRGLGDTNKRLVIQVEEVD